MGLPYYRALASIEVALPLHEQGKSNLAKSLLDEAENIGLNEKDGYFGAGIMRQLAVAHSKMEQRERAHQLFTTALTASQTAKSNQHHARAISRIATAMSDLGYFKRATAVLPDALKLAELESETLLRQWTFYEIAGSLAFSGDFEAAEKALESITPDAALGGKSLSAAAKRDIAWGMARHNQIPTALDFANSISSARERVQALSRIARIVQNPNMNALPRYL